MHQLWLKMRERLKAWEQGETGTNQVTSSAEAKPIMPGSMEDETLRQCQHRYQWRESQPAKKLDDLSTDFHDEDRAFNIETTDRQLYCLCQRTEHGVMIACDNSDCPYEWFHLECLGMMRAPESTWYCSHCRRVAQLRDARKRSSDSGDAEV